MSTKRENPYIIRRVKFSNGEILPLLINRQTQLPLETPTFWITAVRRAQGKQSNTLYNELRAIMYLYLWAEIRGININARLETCQLLDLKEIIDLFNFCGLKLDSMMKELSSYEDNIIPLHVALPARVKPQEKRNRIFSIRSYLEFASSEHLSKFRAWPEQWATHNEMRQQSLDHLSNYIRAIRAPNNDDLGQREGLEKADLNRLLSVIEPDHPDNPFSRKVRFRNFLIIRLFIELGIRRGELLSLYIQDCSITGIQASITIHRRPDDGNDMRTDRPLTKTAARNLPISPKTSDLLHDWIIHHRAKMTESRKHPFLFVSLGSGQPMSLSSINKMFQSLRERVEDLPNKLSPHVLRHTWNDQFSDLIDKKGNIAPDDETKWRARLMGWRNPMSAQHYLRRTTRKRSNEFLSELQHNLTIKVNNGGEE